MRTGEKKTPSTVCAVEGARHVLAITICEVSLPWVGEVFGWTLAESGRTSAGFVVAMVVVAFLSGLGGGVYPAILLSSFRPQRVLAGVDKGVGGRSRVHRGLVLLQFGVTLLLLVSTALIAQQVEHLRSKPLGFQKESVVIVPVFSAKRDLIRQEKIVKAAFLNHPDIVSGTICAPHPGLGTGRQMMQAEGHAGEWLEMQILGVDPDFLRTFDVDLVAGRNLSWERDEDRGHSYLLNETAVSVLGWKDPLGKRFEAASAEGEGRVVGVVKDFHTSSLHDPIEPLVLMERNEKWYLALRIRNKPAEKVLAHLKRTWEDFVPEAPFSFYFLDEHVDKQYRAEAMLSNTTWLFASLATFVACLGLFGLAATITAQRAREIGVRKTFGATTERLVMALSSEFAKPVILAGLFVSPIGYVFVTQWLERFPNRIEVSVWPFALCTLGILAVAMLAVFGQTLKAARADPIEALREG